MTLLRAALRTALRVPVLRAPVNRAAIHYFSTRTQARPRAFSLWSHTSKPLDTDLEGPISEYTSWHSLTDKEFSGRHLGPAAELWVKSLPFDEPYMHATKRAGAVTELFRRPTINGKPAMRSGRSSLLFMFFAQWFTDSILRTHPTDRRKNTSTHDVDLCQIYGLDENTSRLLRSKKNGMLASQEINGEEYLDYLFEKNATNELQLRERYTALPYGHAVSAMLQNDVSGTPFDLNRREKFYATGLERGNSSVGYVAISTLFMREHNRICRNLQQRNPAWDDERIFQTARLINIILLLKLVVEDYINHILGDMLFRLDTKFAEQTWWYRTNWIAIEFDLLYRWHGLVPDEIEIAGNVYDPSKFRNNNALLEQVGLGRVFTDVSRQPAGRIGLSNTPEFLMFAEWRSIKMGRDFRLQSYNAYCERFGLPPAKDFADITNDPGLQKRLATVYGGDIDKLEYVVGVFAGDHEADTPFGALMTRMVAYDAFTQIFTNPLLSRNIFNRSTLTRWGMDCIAETSTIQQLVDRNVQPRPGDPPNVASLGMP